MRAALRAEFPGVRFWVRVDQRTSRPAYSGGHPYREVTVSWLDGPAPWEVERVTRQWRRFATLVNRVTGAA